MSFLIVTRPSCPFCVKAKELLDSKGKFYDELVVGQDVDRDDVVDCIPTERLPERLTVPQIFSGENCVSLETATDYIGGYDELVLHLQ